MNEKLKSKILISTDSSAFLVVDRQSGLDPDFTVADNGSPWTIIETVLEHATALAVLVVSTIYAGDSTLLVEPLPPIAHQDSITRSRVNPWEDNGVRTKISEARRNRIVILGHCFEGGVLFAALGTLEIGY